MGAKVLNSDDEDLKQRVLSGEKEMVRFIRTNNLESSPNGEQSKKIHTDKELAKMADVGTGTIARYNRVMKSDDDTKQRKVAVEYVKLCGYKNGEMGNGRKKECQLGAPTLLSLDQIAEQLGTSKRNLQRALTIERNLTESMKQLLDDGVISKTVQQRKWENVLRNWRDYMEYEKVVLVGMVLISMLKKSLSRILRLKQKNLNQILLLRWEFRLTLFKITKYSLK